LIASRGLVGWPVRGNNPYGDGYNYITEQITRQELTFLVVKSCAFHYQKSEFSGFLADIFADLVGMESVILAVRG
jgi:hypothetical protein